MTDVPALVRSAPTLLVLLVFGCSPRPILDRDWPDAYWRSADYVLIAIDTEAQMSLKIDVKNGKWPPFGNFVDVVDATVFAVGANGHYIVAKQHPLLEDQTHFDHAVTNYFIVDRTISTPRDPRKGVIGPITKEKFEQMAARMSLPRFTKTFPNLEWQRTE